MLRPGEAIQEDEAQDPARPAPPGPRSPEPPTAETDRYLLHPEASLPGHQVDVLVGGGEVFPAMLEAIRGAQREILLETYIWADDATGRRFAEAVIERARAGVPVLVVVDGFGSLGLSEAARGRLRDAGVGLAVFNPVRPWRRRWAWSVRDHRKLLVVDGAVGFAGGLNLGDDYASPEWGGRGWHDIHARISGPEVETMRRQFFASWRHATGGSGPPAVVEPGPAPVPPPGRERVQVLGVGGVLERRRIRRHYHYAVRQAQHAVRIMAGYFIPDRGWRRLLRNAARRGVDVRVVFPHRSDIPATLWAARATYSALLRDGVRVYEWLPSVLHAKALAVDGTACAVGSYNLDRRSLLLNWEISLLVAGGTAPRRLLGRLDADLSQCVEITRRAWERRGIRQRLLEWVCYALRGWL